MKPIQTDSRVDGGIKADPKNGLLERQSAPSARQLPYTFQNMQIELKRISVRQTDARTKLSVSSVNRAHHASLYSVRQSVILARKLNCKLNRGELPRILNSLDQIDIEDQQQVLLSAIAAIPKSPDTSISTLLETGVEIIGRIASLPICDRREVLIKLAHFLIGLRRLCIQKDRSLLGMQCDFMQELAKGWMVEEAVTELIEAAIEEISLLPARLRSPLEVIVKGVSVCTEKGIVLFYKLLNAISDPEVPESVRFSTIKHLAFMASGLPQDQIAIVSDRLSSLQETLASSKVHPIGTSLVG